MTVQVAQFTLNVDTLTDGCEGQKLQALPQFALADENQCHGALGIHSEIRKCTSSYISRPQTWALSTTTLGTAKEAFH
ncbi:hypothetical protein [Fictibacillus enclensis]|uniref:hypothetical protein n=1 Tax=Fictibacillus enclensis TaxID=1017270 RepID=UPI0025A21DCE|nr:hypothetical protein [Fictibacillus enclensis]